MKYQISFDGWDLEHWEKLSPPYEDEEGRLRHPAGDMQKGFSDDVAKTARQYANQLQIRIHHYFLLQSAGVSPEDVEKEKALPLSPYPQQLVDALDSAEAAIAVAAAELEAYFGAVDKKRRQARKDGADVAVRP
tara:strand:- start:10741 stop:11142 length:402 start_codon:yes stop_codon:yes gene_type:complete